MQMIDVMKRLAELDSTNNNVIKESAGIKECGPMGMMGGMEKPSTPASMNITAGSGDELAQMLATIMQMSGGKKDAPGNMGGEPGVEIMTAEPEVSVEVSEDASVEDKKLLLPSSSSSTSSSAPSGSTKSPFAAKITRSGSM